jgi:hypothetical protein
VGKKRVFAQKELENDYDLELFVVLFRIANSVVIIAEHAGSSSSELGS